MYPHLANMPEEHAFAILSQHPVHVCCQMDAALDNSILHGELIGIPFNPSQYRTQLRGVRHALTETLKYLQDRNVRIAGLGALLPSMTRLGETLLTHAGPIGITTGHSFTAYAIAEHVREIERLRGAPAHVAIIGAAGSTGQAAFLSLIADEAARRFTLIDLPQRLSATRQTMSSHARQIHVTADLAAVRECSVVICVTNATTAIIPSDILAQDAVIIDDAQQENVSYQTITERPDVTVIKCLAQVPELNCPFDFGLFPASEFPAKQHIVFTCLAETIALAASRHVGNFTVGIPTPSQIAYIAKVASSMGITIAPFHSFPQIGEIPSHVLTKASRHDDET